MTMSTKNKNNYNSFNCDSAATPSNGTNNLNKIIHQNKQDIFAIVHEHYQDSAP